MNVQWTKRCQHVSKIVVQFMQLQCDFFHQYIYIEAKMASERNVKERSTNLQPSIEVVF